MMKEEKLAVAVCTGDEEAFFNFVSRHKRKLYGVAYSYMHNEADALDMLQEAAYRGWSKCHTLKDPGAMLPWLIRIVIHCCIEELRRQKRRKKIILERSVTYTPEMISVAKLDMEKALSRLKPKYRNAIILRYYNDMTVPEIAQILGKAEGTIKTWLHQGLKQLRGKINYGDEHGGELQHGQS
ncbi:sigma-70 family RNA polymerase sigma factor [Paenibacillus macerans]|uniref:Sigma-70 family RNA polymerase sigma factor n=1 Tax=Paenibacillus macerans TaxID=44252 RepID=A0A6N8EW74_PAEMA|nr:sigma-70 family RNA polymerase sigma factor [Paenibacillus macerans]